MSAFDDDSNLYQLLLTTTLRPWDFNNEKDDDVELDDTAPLPLLIGIGLALFIGFVILVLICCCCRRSRPPASASVPPVSQAAYQRAPFSDGMAGSVAYPMTSLPPESVPFPNSSLGCQPPAPMGPVLKRDYGMIGSGPGMAAMTENMHQVPQHTLQHQPPHFGGVPTFPQNSYMVSLAANPVPGLPPPQTSTLQAPAFGPFSPSSHASSSSASGPSGGGLSPPALPPAVSGHKLSYQPFSGQGYPYQPQHQIRPMLPLLNNHQQQQQQQLYTAGHMSPAMIHSNSYMNSASHNANMSSSVHHHPVQNLPPAPEAHSPPLSSSSPLSPHHLPPPALDNHEVGAGSIPSDPSVTVGMAANSPPTSDRPLSQAESERHPSLHNTSESEDEN